MKQTEEATHVDYSVEYLSSTGEYSRWTIAQHPFRLPVNYGNRRFQRKKRPDFTLTLSPNTDDAQPISLSPFAMEQLLARPLSFVTEPMHEAVEMIGSAFLHLKIAVKDCNELSMFAYLEDVDVASGYSHYVTEGQVPHLITLAGCPLRMRTSLRLVLSQFSTNAMHLFH